MSVLADAWVCGLRPLCQLVPHVSERVDRDVDRVERVLTLPLGLMLSELGFKSELPAKLEFAPLLSVSGECLPFPSTSKGAQPD